MDYPETPFELCRPLQDLGEGFLTFFDVATAMGAAVPQQRRPPSFKANGKAFPDPGCFLSREREFRVLEGFRGLGHMGPQLRKTLQR